MSIINKEENMDSNGITVQTERGKKPPRGKVSPNRYARRVLIRNGLNFWNGDQEVRLITEMDIPKSDNHWRGGGWQREGIALRISADAWADFVALIQAHDPEQEGA